MIVLHLLVEGAEVYELSCWYHSLCLRDINNHNLEPSVHQAMGWGGAIYPPATGAAPTCLQAVHTRAPSR